MVSNNWKNGVNESSENENKKKREVDYKGLVKKYFQSHDDFSYKTVSEIQNTTVLNDIQQLNSGSDENNEFFQKDENKQKILQEINSVLDVLRENIKRLRNKSIENIQKRYDIIGDSWLNSISEHLSNLSWNKLKNIISFDKKKLAYYLENNNLMRFCSSKENSAYESFLDMFLKNDSQYIFWESVLSGNKVPISEIKSTITLLSKDQLIELSKYYDIALSLKDLEQIDSTIDLSFLSEKFPWKTKKELLSLDITVFLSEIVWNEKILIEKITEQIWKELDLDISELREHINTPENEFYSELEKDSKPPYDYQKLFIDYIIQSDEIPHEIKNNLSKFKVWSYISFIFSQKWIETTNYLKIDKINSWTSKKYISFLELTSPLWDSFALDDTNAKSIPYTYFDLFNYFKETKKQNPILRNFSFYDENEFKSLWLKKHSESSDVMTLDVLKWELNLIDSDWADFWFWVNETVIDNWKGDIFTIEYISEERQEIVLNGWKDEKISFQDFLANAKEYKWFNRQKKLNNQWDFVNSLMAKWDKYAWINLNENKLQASQNIDWKKQTVDVTTFVWEWKMIYIHSMNWSNIEYSIGEFEEEKSWEKKWKKWTVYKKNWFNQFMTDLKSEKFIPEYNIEESFNNFKDVERKSNLLFWYMKFSSIHDLIYGFKSVWEWIESMFKRSSDLKAQKFALKLAKTLPWTSLEKSLRSQVDAKIKDQINKKVDEIKSDNDASAVVLSILKNKSADDWEIEAAIIAMSKKYWNLYAKTMAPYRGSFIYYKALHGRKNDSIYLEAKKELAESWDSRNFDTGFWEEYLVEKLFKERAKKWLSPLRFDKEFWNGLSEGRNSELEDGDTKAWNKSNVKARQDYFIWVLKWWEHANACGSIEKILWKNGSAYEMHFPSFILAVSWVTNDFHDVLNTKIGWLAYTSPYVLFLFALWKPSLTKMLHECIESLLQEETLWFPQDSLKLFHSIQSADNVKDRVERTEAFYKKYGEKLLPLLSWKSAFIYAKKDENPAYWKYYSFIHDQLNSWDYNLKNEYLDEWRLWVWNTPISLFVDNHSMLDTYIQWTQPGWFRPPGKDVVEMYLKHMEDIRNETNLTSEEKKDTLIKLFTVVEEKVKSANGMYKWSKSYKNTEIYEVLSSHGVDIYRWSDRVSSVWKKNLKNHIEFVVENFLNGYNLYTKEWKTSWIVETMKDKLNEALVLRNEQKEEVEDFWENI